ncbi:MAG TPA: PstS family phosphate ABC transporter substrate-binding protein [Candidatus Krumholzibacteria bacterium]|nr:PstS family phosphate ABC transporter substrate-binding protein [Candidatus Krumholzibacteria bacterium]
MIRKPFLTLSMAVAAVSTLVFAGMTIASNLTVDPKLPPYKLTSGISGSVKSVGSDTMNNLMALWAGDFRKNYPNVQVEIEGKGSSTAPPALIAGTATFGPMSRAMKNQEIDEFEAKFGYKPMGLRSAIDMLAVYVHKDNPIESMTMQQIDAIFSKTRKGGHSTEITTWGQLGLTGEWANKPISLYGRNSASGTYGYFKEHALFKGDFKDAVKEQPGSSSVVQGVASDKFGIGYSGIGYITADVRAVPIKADPASEAVPASAEFAYTGTYPLARYLYVYVNAKPGAELDPLRREFIRFIFSKEGQSSVIKDGYYPVNAKIAGEELAKLGLDVSSRR